MWSSAVRHVVPHSLAHGPGRCHIQSGEWSYIQHGPALGPLSSPAQSGMVRHSPAWSGSSLVWSGTPEGSGVVRRGPALNPGWCGGRLGPAWPACSPAWCCMVLGAVRREVRHVASQSALCGPACSEGVVVQRGPASVPACHAVSVRQPLAHTVPSVMLRIRTLPLCEVIHYICARSSVILWILSCAIVQVQSLP